jgi:hypothetical protein
VTPAGCSASDFYKMEPDAGPYSHVWTVATRIEETTEEERQARLARIHMKAPSSGT